jgi:Uma2 family endonuclease
MRRPSPTGRPATWEDLEDVPEAYVGEIVAGELVLTPRPAAAHQTVTSELGFDLIGPFGRGRGGPGGLRFLDEPYVRWGTDVRAPDLAGWRNERFVAPERGPIEVIPDWLCEVLSPSTAVRDRAEKMPLYAAHGVKHMWIIDPLQRSLEVFRLEHERWSLLGVHHGDEKVRAEPFDAVELDLAVLWAGSPPLPTDDDY